MIIRNYNQTFPHSNNREDIYGKTKHNSKNYKENKLSDNV